MLPFSLIILSLITVFPVKSNTNTSGNDDVSICAVIKSYYLNDTIEWIEYHLKMAGLKKMFIFDHNSPVALNDALQEYIKSGFVHYEKISHTGSDYLHSAQNRAYDLCIKKHCSETGWMAFIDSDEFIVLNSTFPSLSSFVGPYRNYSIIYLNWIVISSGEHIHRPEGGILSNYIKCLPNTHSKNHVYKAIGNCKFITQSLNPHTPAPAMKGLGSINSNGEPAILGTTYTLENSRHKNAVLYHYMFRSRDESLVKIKDGSGSGVHHKSLKHYSMIQKAATENCTDLQKKAKNINWEHLF